MKLQLLLALLLTHVCPAAESAVELRELKPIVDQVLSTSKPDLSEFSYACARAGALFNCLGIYIDENPGNPEDKDTAKAFLARANKFFRVGTQLATLGNKTAEAFAEQVGALMTIYTDEILTSKKLNNTIFGPRVNRDLDAAMKLGPVVEPLADLLSAKRK